MQFEKIRIAVDRTDLVDSGPVERFFDILANNNGLTEEYLYHHQPTTEDVVFVYSTSPNPVGRLDVATATKDSLVVLDAPLIVVARKGYAGRMFVVSEGKVVVHEDAYAIRPKPDYRDKIALDWFAAHYSDEFQSYRTSEDGIGDFPRSLLRTRAVAIPRLEVQREHAKAYTRRDKLLKGLKRLSLSVGTLIDRKIGKAPTDGTSAQEAA